MNKAILTRSKILEAQILNLIGIRKEHFNISECYLDENRYIHYVELNKIDKSKNVLLMVHGYLGSNIAFFKMYKELMNHFHIISIDFTGHGLSSSDQNTPQSIDAWIDYFVRDIKLFLKKMDLTKVNILGHSLGCFILTHFMNKHPDMIEQVFLLSPGGVNEKNIGFMKKAEEMVRKKGILAYYFAKFMIRKIFKQKLSPLNIWFVGIFRRWIARIVYKGERLKLTKEEQKLFVPLYQNIYYSVPSSEKCVGYIFNEGPMSERPLMKIFKQFHDQKNIHIFYGETDVMDYQLTSNRINRYDLNISVEHIPDCGHQIMFQNPIGAANAILKRYRDNIKSKNDYIN